MIVGETKGKPHPFEDYRFNSLLGYLSAIGLSMKKAGSRADPVGLDGKGLMIGTARLRASFEFKTNQYWFRCGNTTNLCLYQSQVLDLRSVRSMSVLSVQL